MFSSELIQEMEQNRVRLTGTLILYVKTDTVLFAFNEECKKCFMPILTAANKVLNTVFILTQGLDVADVNFKQDDNVREYLNRLSIQQFALVCLTAVEIRSVLLAILFAAGMIGYEKVWEIAFYEELWQQRKWGQTAEAQEKNNNIREMLAKLELLRDGKGLSQN